MKILFAILGFLLLHRAQTNIVEIHAMAWPTAASNTQIRTFSFLINIQILENLIKIAPIFYTLLIFSEDGFIGDYDMKKLNTEITYNGTSIDGYALGYDEIDGSTVTLNKRFPFSQSNITIQISNMHFVETNYKIINMFVLLLASENDIIVMKRVKMPFHFDSGIWSDVNKTTVSLSFLSSIGYQSSAFIQLQFPSCMPLDDSKEFKSCGLMQNFSLTTGYYSRPICNIENNTLTIHNLNGSYPTTNQTVLIVHITFPSYHSCDNFDYTYLTVKESLKGKLLENVVFAGINEDPLPKFVTTVSSNAERIIPSLLLLLLIVLAL